MAETWNHQDAELEPIILAIQKSFVKEINVGSVVFPKNTVRITKDYVLNLLEPKIEDALMKESPFGKFNQTVVDPSVRRSKEIELTQNDTPDWIYLSLLGQSIVSKYCDGFYCVPYKIIKYAEGDFFQPHTDTPSENLKKSLVLHLPTKCKGGQLMFNSYDPSLRYEPSAINYLLFDINHVHNVAPVIEGERYSITYKVYEFMHLSIDKLDEGLNHLKLEVPKEKTNVLFLYSKLDSLEDAFLKNGINFVYVYFDEYLLGCYWRPWKVYDKYIEELSDCGSECYGFDDIRAGNEYVVNKIVDVGTVPKDSVEYMRHYGYTGNAAFEKTNNVNYAIGLLVNPVKNCEIAPKKRKHPCDEEDNSDLESN